jgi:hypothetical protein
MSRESSGVIAIAELRVGRSAVVLQSALPPPEELDEPDEPDELDELLPPAPLELLLALLLELLLALSPLLVALAVLLVPPVPLEDELEDPPVPFVSAVSPHPPLIAAAPTAIDAIQPKWRSAERPVEALLLKLIMQALLSKAIQCDSLIGSPRGQPAARATHAP